MKTITLLSALQPGLIKHFILHGLPNCHVLNEGCVMRSYHWQIFSVEAGLLWQSAEEDLRPEE